MKNILIYETHSCGNIYFDASDTNNSAFLRLFKLVDENREFEYYLEAPKEPISKQQYEQSKELIANGKLPSQLLLEATKMVKSYEKYQKEIKHIQERQELYDDAKDGHAESAMLLLLDCCGNAITQERVL